MIYILDWLINRSMNSVYRLISTLEKAKKNARKVAVKCNYEQRKLNAVKLKCRKVDALCTKLTGNLK